MAAGAVAVAIVSSQPHRQRVSGVAAATVAFDDRRHDRAPIAIIVMLVVSDRVRRNVRHSHSNVRSARAVRSSSSALRPRIARVNGTNSLAPPRVSTRNRLLTVDAVRLLPVGASARISSNISRPRDQLVHRIAAVHRHVVAAVPHDRRRMLFAVRRHAMIAIATSTIRYSSRPASATSMNVIVRPVIASRTGGPRLPPIGTRATTSALIEMLQPLKAPLRPTSRAIAETIRANGMSCNRGRQRLHHQQVDDPTAIRSHKTITTWRNALRSQRM